MDEMNSNVPAGLPPTKRRIPRWAKLLSRILVPCCSVGAVIWLGAWIWQYNPPLLKSYYSELFDLGLHYPPKWAYLENTLLMIGSPARLSMKTDIHTGEALILIARAPTESWNLPPDLDPKSIVAIEKYLTRDFNCTKTLVPTQTRRIDSYPAASTACLAGDPENPVVLFQAAVLTEKTIISGYGISSTAHWRDNVRTFNRILQSMIIAPWDFGDKTVLVVEPNQEIAGQK